MSVDLHVAAHLESAKCAISEESDRLQTVDAITFSCPDFVHIKHIVLENYTNYWPKRFFKQPLEAVTSSLVQCAAKKCFLQTWYVVDPFKQHAKVFQVTTYQVCPNIQN